uniref:Uncharacterized protein n=1 Tax=Nannospalax galili TaxID=1026970 RepID=A0A8C6RG44_NANGA
RKEEQIDAKPQKTRKEKKERGTPSDDEEENLFAPPKLTDEDFTPFGSRSGLFSGGQGLFDDDEESDLFREAPWSQPAQASVSEGDTDVFGATSAPSLKERQRPEQPIS